MATRTSTSARSDRSQLAAAALYTVGAGVLLTAAAPRVGAVLWAAAVPLAVWALLRDRRHAKVWPAWTALAVVLVGLMAAVPTARSERQLAEDVGEAQAGLVQTSTLLEEMVQQCEVGFDGTCSPAALVATPAGRAAHAREGRRCVDPDTVCVTETPARALRMEVVTPELEKIGPLRLTYTYDLKGAPALPTCSAVRPEAPAALVARACGPGVPVV
ncbi:MAG: hypothetical protein JWO69_1446 [Thermoleophilia bacterium]|jgi:hypothetical protein|nr:hypothetical protein [Thermoleophilia bacterium]